MARQRSLGTRKIEGNAIRLGTIDEDGRDRLRARTSNIGSRSSIDSAARFSTPQSIRTPMSGTNRILGFNSGSTSRRNNVSSLSRSSAIGAKKDLNDKVNQQQAEQDIIDFCRSQGYERAECLQIDGPKRSFPLNSTEFRMLFTFIMRIYEPEFEDLEAKTMAENIAIILKTIGYPGHVSKQMFQTLGTKHSWVNVLSILLYLINRAKQMLFVGDNWKKIGFSNRDEHGFEINDRESEDLIRFEFFAKSYNSWDSTGNDNFNEYLDELESRFYAREGLNRRESEKIPYEVKEVRNQLQHARAEACKAEEEVRDISDRIKAKTNDAKKMKGFGEQLEKHKASKNEELDMVKAEIESLRKKKVSLEDVLDKENMKERNNADLEVDLLKINRVVQLLETQKNEEKEICKNHDNAMWQKEMEFAKTMKEVNDVCQTFNEKLISLGLFSNYRPDNLDKDSAISFKLESSTPLNDVVEWLKETDNLWKMDEKLREEEFSLISREVDELENLLRSKITHFEQVKKTKSKVIEESLKRENTMNSEERRLKDKLSHLKEEVHVEKTRDRTNLSEPQEKLKCLMEEEEKLTEEKRKVSEQGEKLLRKAGEKLLNDKKEQTKIYQEYEDSYKKAAFQKVDRINAESAEIQKYWDDVKESLEVVVESLEKKGKGKISKKT